MRTYQLGLIPGFLHQIYDITADTEAAEYLVDDIDEMINKSRFHPVIIKLIVLKIATVKVDLWAVFFL